MARSLNKATLIGSLGKDPEMRFMPNGNAVCNFTMATDESYNDRNSGQKVEKTEWHRISAFGKLAEIMGQYLKKGSKVYIEGKLQTREWEKDGIKRYTTEIIASDMLMLDSKGDNSGAGYNAGQGMGQQPQQQAYQAPQNASPHNPMPQNGGMGGNGYQAPQNPAQQNPGQPRQPQQAAGGYQAPRPQGNNMGGGYQQPQQPPQQPQQPATANAFDDFDDDIPF